MSRKRCSQKCSINPRRSFTQCRPITSLINDYSYYFKNFRVLKKKGLRDLDFSASRFARDDWLSQTLLASRFARAYKLTKICLVSRFARIGRLTESPSTSRFARGGRFTQEKVFYLFFNTKIINEPYFQLTMYLDIQEVISLSFLEFMVPTDFPTLSGVS